MQGLRLRAMPLRAAARQEYGLLQLERYVAHAGNKRAVGGSALVHRGNHMLTSLLSADLTSHGGGELAHATARSSSTTLAFGPEGQPWARPTTLPIEAISRFAARRRWLLLMSLPAEAAKNAARRAALRM